MLSSAAEMLALKQVSDLERPLAAVEDALLSLGAALRDRDATRIEAEAALLHRALAAAVDHFARAARIGPIPGILRQRLMIAGGQVAAQREVLARATASLDRAIDVLLPGLPSGVYSAGGTAERLSQGGELHG